MSGREKIIGNVKVVGDVVAGGTDVEAPVAVGMHARTTNPTAVSNATKVRPMADDLGRAVITPHQVRDLLATATASLTTGTVAELIAGVTSTYLDLVQISFSNNSTVAATVTIEDESTVVHTVRVPADNTITLHFPTPIPQSTTGVAWYVDMDDVSGTTVSVEAMFIKNV